MSRLSKLATFMGAYASVTILGWLLDVWDLGSTSIFVSALSLGVVASEFVNYRLIRYQRETIALQEEIIQLQRAENDYLTQRLTGEL